MNADAYLPYGRHSIDEDDIAAVAAVMRSDYLTTGPAVEGFEHALGAALGVTHVIACNSGTAALHLAMAAAGIGPGDVVVVPAITFVASANAARFVGAEVVFADVDPDSGLMTAELLEAALRRCRRPPAAVVPVHLNGQAAPLAPLAALARAHRLAIVSDCCHALGTRYLDGAGGCVGDGAYEDLATFSFHPVKTITMGEGGAVTTRSEALAARLRRLRSHGIERSPSAFVDPAQGRAADGSALPWYYEMQALGWNYRATDLACALGTSQLGKLARFAARRRALAAHYDALFAAAGLPLRPVARTPGLVPVWHLYAVLIDYAAAGTTRAALMRALAARGIGTQVHYIPLYHQPYYRHGGGGVVADPAGLPGAEAYYARVLSLPLYPAMSEADVERVVGALGAVLSGAGA